MLQQTRVETVIGYYERFLRRFPTIETLARAKHDTVLRHWAGLGYYQRALHLHRAAKLLHARGDGVPRTVDALRRLPGIGEYTAAAIASIAFRREAAAVDGNVARVLARLFGLTLDIRSGKGKAHIADLARELLPTKRPGDFNQAWMDLGSLICTPRTPQCPRCPLARDCAVAGTDRAESFPFKTGRERRVTEVTLVAAVLALRGRILMRRRPEGGLWSGLWEIPHIEINPSPKSRDNGTSAQRHARLALHRLAKQERVEVLDLPLYVGTFVHRLTHRAITFHLFVARVEPVHAPATPQNRDRKGVISAQRWVTRRGFTRLGVSTASRRILAASRESLDAILSRQPSAES